MIDDMDPIVIDPPNFDKDATWAGYQKSMDNVQGIDGKTNWRAAFDADPGCCSCPVCDTYYWALGQRQRCRKCGFEYETDWWAMYSWGVQAAWRISGELKATDPDLQRRLVATAQNETLYRRTHPYWKYGFAHPPKRTIDLYKHATKTIDWKKVYLAGEL